MKKKLHLARFVTLFSVVTATTLSFGSAIQNSKAAFIIDDTSYYTITYGGHKFRCYKIDDTENPAEKKAAIAWLWTSDNSNPQTFTDNKLTLPDSVTIEGDSYTISAIYKAGFRDCEFEEIVLPDTIEEIGSEAFAYCMNLKEFSIPHLVNKIAPSTFMDCQNLEIFYYTGLEEEIDPDTGDVIDTKEVKRLGNSTITEIGDHAFDNCVKLKGLYFPSSLVAVGNSAFQRCKLLQNLYFPSDNHNVDDDLRNYITVGAYAFADCPILNTVYFETNMQTIGEYAFANDKEDLMFTYTGSETKETFDASWPNWRKKNITSSTSTKYDFINMQQPIHIDDDFPGLIFSYHTDPITLNSTKSETPVVLDSSTEEYVRIDGFQEPFTTLPGYYDVTTKTFTVPNTVHGKKVKIIGKLAGLPFKTVIFNRDLVQIQTRAFYGCNDIESLVFTACKHLKEISYEIFQSPCPELESMKTPNNYVNNQYYNSTLHSIALPSCLEYIGDSAFYNFTSLTEGITFRLPDPDDPTGPVPESKLKVIGDFAFSVHRSKNITQTKLIDIELPNSLNDAAYEEAEYYHPYTPSWNAGDTERKNRYAVGRFCFENQDIIGTVTMQKATAAQAEDENYTTSFMTNAFVRCNNISKFKSNENLFLIGADTFKLCPNLKEVFLYGKKANDAGVHFAWGITDQGELQGGTGTYTNGMFSRNNDENGNINARPDTVIYVHESAAPGRLDNEALCKTGVPMWNSDITNSLTTGMAYNDSNPGQTGNKKKMPTFYNSNWEDDPTTVANDINIYYWKPGTSADSYAGETRNVSGSGEYTLASHEYNEGYIAFAPSPTSGKYTVAKYFTDGASGNYKDEINLTNIANTYVTNFSSKLDTIAGCAFADGNNKNRGVFFVLPSGITTIEDRAFYRKSSSSTSVKIVTYKDGGTIKVPTGEATAYDTLISNWSKKTYNYNDNKGGYCVLPTGLKKIMSNSFFNNRFKTIELNSDLEFLGASAFAVPQYTNLQTSLIFTPGAGSKFSVGTGDAAGGIYYTANANKKMLVFQIGGAADSTLVIDSGTKAIGFRSMIRTNYTTVNIQTGLTTIYGQAFYNNKSIITFGGALSSLKYISARVDKNDADGDTEVYDAYDGTFPFDNYDVTHIANWGPTHDTYINAYTVGAFDGADNMTTIDFTQMTSIKKIGEKAFQNCKKLQYLTGTGANEKTYTFIDYSGKNSTQTADITSKTDSILDLSNCKKLKSVSANAFKEVKIPVYTILPNTTGKTIDTESTITLANDSNVLPPNSIRLIGDTWHQAGLNSNTSALKPRTHYPSNALRGDEQYVFYRFFMDGFPTGVTINDYVTTSGTVASLMQYWTIYNDEYYLFKGPKQVLKFHELVTAGTYTRGQALGYTED